VSNSSGLDDVGHHRARFFYPLDYQFGS
jgi:hypothetical protein